MSDETVQRKGILFVLSSLFPGPYPGFLYILDFSFRAWDPDKTYGG
jgi:hypothetical protein